MDTVEESDEMRGIIDASFTAQVEDSPSPDAEVEYTRKMGYGVGLFDETDIDDSILKDSESAKQKFNEIEKLNTFITDEIGATRKYVAGPTDVPETAYTYKDDYGTYYYERKFDKVRPSDVLKDTEYDHWVELSDNEKTLFTLAHLKKMYPWALYDADSVEKAATLIDRLILDGTDVTKDDDVFTLEEYDALVSAM